MIKFISKISDSTSLSVMIYSKSTISLINRVVLALCAPTKYNIKLVDDASYPYILITNEKYPRLLVVREKINKKKGKYFGPYPSASSARKTALLLNKIYPFRKCNNIPKKECLYYHIGACLAPCIKHDVSYKEEVEKVIRFLKGVNFI